MSGITAILPAFKEEISIGSVILRARPLADRVIVVSDGSSDGTAEMASALGAYVIRHEKNSGYGAALRTCFETARALDADKMVIIDPDGQHNDAEILELLDGLQEGNDAVLQETEFLSGSGGLREVGYRELRKQDDLIIEVKDVNRKMDWALETGIVELKSDMAEVKSALKAKGII